MLTVIISEVAKTEKLQPPLFSSVTIFPLLSVITGSKQVFSHFTITSSSRSADPREKYLHGEETDCILFPKSYFLKLDLTFNFVSFLLKGTEIGTLSSAAAPPTKVAQAHPGTSVYLSQVVPAETSFPEVWVCKDLFKLKAISNVLMEKLGEKL